MAWLTGWAHRKSITIDNAQVDATLTNYPALISFTDADLAHTGSGGGVEEIDADDIRFTSDDGETELDFEIEEYTPSTGEVIAWVRIPSLSDSVDTDIYIYYGNQYIEGGEAQDSVWDSDYVMVKHCAEDPDDHDTINNTATYESFGIGIRTAQNAIIWFGRTGSDHVGNDGKLVKSTYNPSTHVWGAYSDVYDDASYDSRNVGGGTIDGDIYLFFARYDDGGVGWVDLGYIKSTDDGATWGSYTTVTVDVALTGFSPYGSIVRVGSTYYQPYYGNNGAGTFKIKLLESTDGGDTWSDSSTIYSGATAYTECCIAYLSGTNMVALARQDAGGVLRQFQSGDSGQTWANTGNTNIGGAAVNMGWIIRDGERLIVATQDRAGTQLKLHEAIESDIWGVPLGWKYGSTILAGLGGSSGYPCVVKWTPAHYVITVSDEQGANDADMYAVHWSSRLLSSQNRETNGSFGNMDSTDQVSGTVDGALEFDGAAEYVNENGSIDDLNFFHTTGIFTIEAIIELVDHTANAVQIIAGSTASSTENGMFLAYENRGGVGTKQFRLYLAKSVVGVPIIDSFSNVNSIGDNNPHHLVVTGDGTNVTFYIDGVTDAGTGNMGAKGVGNATREINFARYNYAPPGGYWDGVLDEIRISDIERTATYASTAHNNLLDPGAFIDLGDEEGSGEAIFFGTVMGGGVVSNEYPGITYDGDGNLRTEGQVYEGSP
jgi:hypothetical protein